MDRKEQLQELHLTLEAAADQLTRAQRLAGDTLGIPGFPERIDRLLAETVAARNEVRDVLLRTLASRGPKLPIVD